MILQAISQNKGSCTLNCPARHLLNSTIHDSAFRYTDTVPKRFKLITGFVLTGGASRRMGRPKALLVLGGQTLLERQLRLLREVVSSVGVVGWPADVPFSKLPLSLGRVTCWPDDLPDRGPLGGIYTGLKRSRREYNLFLSCDMPFIDANFLRFLCQRAIASRADVTVPKSRERRLNPVCAVYRRRALKVIHQNLELGENKITRFFPSVRCEVITWREISRAGFAPTILDNMNTPQDYSEADKMLVSETKNKLTPKNSGLKPNDAKHRRQPA
jgi:molybdopterin-guanine dinucleotide biosynthesis protein A